MTGSLALRGARLVLPDRVVTGDLLVVDGVIEGVGATIPASVGEEVDASGWIVLPGAIDALVSVPLGSQDDGTPLSRVSGTAASSGVTTLLLEDPAAPLFALDELEAALARVGRHARTHFGLYAAVDPARPHTLPAEAPTPGVRLRVGGRGDAEMPDDDALDAVFARTVHPIVAEGQDAVAARAREALYADAVDPAEHGAIYEPALAARVVETLVRLARRHGRALHLPRVTTAAELAVLEDRPPQVTAGCPITHLALDAVEAVPRLGTRAVTDPPLRSPEDVAALWDALAWGGLDSVASGHAHVLARDKDLPYPRTASGLPSLLAFLPLLVEAAEQGRCSLVDVARWTAGEPARRLGLGRKGRLEVGFDADLAVFEPGAETIVGPPWSNGSEWSPFEGRRFPARPVMTILGGRLVYTEGRLVDGVRGRAIAPHRRA